MKKKWILHYINPRGKFILSPHEKRQLASVNVSSTKKKKKKTIPINWHTTVTHCKANQSWRCLTRQRSSFYFIYYFYIYRATVPAISEARVGIASLSQAANMGRNCQECRFVILILTPTKVVRLKCNFNGESIFSYI